MSTSGVEVSEKSSVPLVTTLASLLGLCSLSVDMVCDHHLDGELCVSVWVGRSERAVLWDGDHVWESCRIAVDGSGRGEDNVGDVVLGHGLEKSHSAANVDAIVVQRDLSRLADSLYQRQLREEKQDKTVSTNLERSKVNDTVNLGVLLENLLQGSLVCDVHLVQLWPLSCEQLYSVDALFARVIEVVDDDDIVAGLEKGKRCERADVPCATVCR